MAEERKITFLNLIDRVLVLENGGKVKADEVFRKLLSEYFFKTECSEKKVLNVIKGLELPSFLTASESLLEVDYDQFAGYVKGSYVTDSLSGKVILSKPFLQIFYRDHPPEVAKMPSDVQLEVLSSVKYRNGQILYAFQKMHDDVVADKQRTVTGLIALILKNIRMRTGISYSELDRPAAGIISDIFKNSNDRFTASQEQTNDISDDKHIKALIKEFCVIRKNSELTEMADLFKKEFERYKVRARFAASHTG
jgi:hypothetical protein